MITWNKPSISLEAKYSLVIRISLITALLFLAALLVAVPRIPEKPKVLSQPTVEIQNVDIPETQQYQRPPAPARPTVPVASTREDIPEDLTIQETTFEEFAAVEAPPPPPKEVPRVKFIPYDEPPLIIGGIDALRRNVKYPDIAKEAGVEGTVVLQAYISDKGIVEDVIILKGLPNTGLDQAAIEAVKKTRFKPAKQRDRNVGVWYSIPIIFTLKTSG